MNGGYTLSLLFLIGLRGFNKYFTTVSSSSTYLLFMRSRAVVHNWGVTLPPPHPGTFGNVLGHFLVGTQVEARDASKYLIMHRTASLNQQRILWLKMPKVITSMKKLQLKKY